MKGLLIKDFYCLRKQLTTYAFIIVGVMVISILFVLSYKFGNMHVEFQDMVDSGQNSEEFITEMATYAILMFMLLPIACTGDIASLFTDDENASFYKVASSLPVSINKRVASRFFSGIAFIVIGAVVDFVMTVVLSRLTDVISFGEFMGVIISFGSLMLMYISMLILCIYLLGKGKSTYAGLIPMLIGGVLWVLINLDKIRYVFDAELEETEEAMVDLMQGTIDFIKYKSYVLLIIAILVSLVSYVLAVCVAKRKRGVA